MNIRSIGPAVEMLQICALSTNVSNLQNLFDVVVITAFHMSGGISACNSHNFQVFLDWANKIRTWSENIFGRIVKNEFCVCRETLWV